MANADHSLSALSLFKSSVYYGLKDLMHFFVFFDSWAHLRYTWYKSQLDLLHGKDGRKSTM